MTTTRVSIEMLSQMLSLPASVNVEDVTVDQERHQLVLELSGYGVPKADEVDAIFEHLPNQFRFLEFREVKF